MIADEIASFRRAVQRSANNDAAFYGGPVYLVGGALSDGALARDWDIRVVVAEHELLRRFGRPIGWTPPSFDATDEWEWRCWREERKRSIQLSMIANCCVDFQLEDPQLAARFDKLDRVRLDFAPAWFRVPGSDGFAATGGIVKPHLGILDAAAERVGVSRDALSRYLRARGVDTAVLAALGLDGDVKGENDG